MAKVIKLDDVGPQRVCDLSLQIMQRENSLKTYFCIYQILEKLEIPKEDIDIIEGVKYDLMTAMINGDHDKTRLNQERERFENYSNKPLNWGEEPDYTQQEKLGGQK